MNLQKYDNKLIQIIDNQNNKYEGICEYYNQEYSFHEYGKDEDCLEIFGFLFYKKDIKKIKCIRNYTSKYSNIEKIIVDDGIDSIKEAFESEENDYIYRILLYLEENIINDKIKKELIELANHNTDNRIHNKVNELLK